MLTRYLGLVDYEETVAAMQSFTTQRSASTEDELWLCQHPPTYTQGIAGKAEHLLLADDQIPVVQTNRGGQITYHGPGQVVAYVLLDLRRKDYLVKEFVRRLEQAIINTLAHFGAAAQRIASAPGVYIALPTGAALASPQTAFADVAKVAALGIKVSNHCTYHGLALNVNMDLSPYNNINPCGYAGLRTVDLTTIGLMIEWQSAAETLAAQLCEQLAR